MFLVTSYSTRRIYILRFVFLQSLSCVWLFATARTAALWASLSFTVSQSLLKFISIKSVRLSNSLTLCFPLFLLPSIFPASESFTMSWLFASGGQSMGASASASVLPMTIQGWFDLLTRFDLLIKNYCQWLFTYLSSPRSIWSEETYLCYIVSLMFSSVLGTQKALNTYVLFIYLKRGFCQIWKRHVHRNVHCSTVYHSQDMEAT